VSTCAEYSVCASGTKYAPCFEFHRHEQRVHHLDFGGKLAERLAHRGQRDDAVRLGDAARNAGQESQLDGQPDHRLVILIDVRRRRMELALTHLDVFEHEDAFPRHLHVVKIDDGVVLIEAARERIVEHRRRGLLVGFARKHFQAGRVDRHHERDRVALVARRQRLDTRHE
jgi:hypothetical protein